jgi:predicted anti-sigma-YlaC factor YlaD
MNCERIHDQLPDVALGVAPAPPEVEAHLRECRACSETLESLRATMKLMDAWEAPEPSPYWDTRMQARLREEQQRRSAGRLHWIRRPALGVAAVLCLAVGIGVVHLERSSTNGPLAKVAPVGTAVSDLQYLDKNSNLLQNFDALDYISGDADWDSIN